MPHVSSLENLTECTYITVAMSKDHDFVVKFIDIYKTSPCLWNARYHNANIRGAVYTLLLQKYQEYHNKATKTMVKSKINSLRSTYNKELKKIKDSERSGAGTGEVNKPSLWYYDLLSFVSDQQPTVTSVNTMEDEDENQEVISDNLLQEKVKRLESDLKLEKSKNADLEIQTNVDTNKVDSRKNWSVINQQNLINNNVNKDKKGVTAVTTQPSTVSIQGQEPSVSTSFAAVIQKKKKEINNESRPIISSKQVSEAVLEAKSKTVLNNLIHIEENTENESAHFHNGPKKILEKKENFL
ncbi:hypothetical protein JTB14_034987 [Gonioctena quinquepunctata]|nr:hypothetical protein JTB14_034987 [Gonioctena quinquepunctata]